MMPDGQSIVTPPYHVQSTAKEIRSGFPYFAYHASISALWRDKWRLVCAHGIYPFTDGKVEDFDPVFEDLVRQSGDSPQILFRPDDYAKPFFSVAENLVADAEKAEAAGDPPQARDLYLRAAAVYRIARFPINRSPASQDAWEKGRDVYIRGGRYLDPPSAAIDIPFRHANLEAGDEEAPIPAFLRMPKGERPEQGWPVLLFICGLDAYRPDHTPRTQIHVDRGFATLSFEIPGTGDCPAAPDDPEAPDRLMSSVLDWVADNSGDMGFDTSRIMARGISTGGYYAMRVAHTHADRLLAVVAQGGGCHHMFNPDWVHAQNQMEYPFALADALAHKFGFRGSEPVASYAAGGSKFSLVEAGILGVPSCKLLVINGIEDSIFPIEDSLIVALSGRNKDLISRGNLGHMGNPGGEEIQYDWIDTVVAASR